jgi:hypothetical protein
MQKISLTGYVAKAQFGQGSKSEHDALKISSGPQEFFLRMPNQNPFEIVVQNEALIGKRVHVEGFVEGTTLFANHLQVCG